MYREKIKDLIKWKDSKDRKPLLITGVRQCGKTYLVGEFAREYFKSYVYINFESSEKLGAIFDFDFDVRRILSEIEIEKKEKIVPGETLVFFDEIQACPRAITSLKYFREDMPGLHVVCAGSLLGVALKKMNISFPVGKVNRMRMYPMSFKEFILANGREDLVEILGKWQSGRSIPELYSVPMEKLLREYYIVGGMPEAVNTWLETKDYQQIDRVQRDILQDYEDDFSKHAPATEVPKIRWIWESVPVQLGKENNKFVFSHVKEGKRSAELEDALQWLINAGLVDAVYLVADPELPLSGFADKTYFKVYMSDIGLLRAKSGISPRTVEEEDGAYIRYKGAFAENYVYNELKALDKASYFWRSGNTAEVDFLFERDGYMIPVEVKSADNTQAKSYKSFCKKYKPAKGLKLSRKNLGRHVTEDVTTTFSLPLYLCWDMDRYLDE